MISLYSTLVHQFEKKNNNLGWVHESAEWLTSKHFCMYDFHTCANPLLGFIWFSSLKYRILLGNELMLVWITSFLWLVAIPSTSEVHVHQHLWNVYVRKLCLYGFVQLWLDCTQVQVADSHSCLQMYYSYLSILLFAWLYIAVIRLYPVSSCVGSLVYFHMYYSDMLLFYWIQ